MAIYKNGITGGELGAAVAEAIVHDIRVNATGINGFPQIKISRPDPSTPTEFLVGLVWGNHRIEFTLSNVEAAAAIKKMKAGPGHDNAIFDRVQEAFATLEHRVVNDHSQPE